ncbi:MAG: MFS transporter [Clostridiales Family XIII bacterium]|nr:MFS transporter [Clostridia bacterium]MDY3010681.1 MFS transporter [Clostridiales Family XIII bacterium]
MNRKTILLISVGFFWFAQYVYVPFQTPYLAAMNVGSKFIGIIVGTYGISQMALRLPVGVLADTQNRHKVIIVAGGAASGIASLFRVILNNGMGFWAGNLFSGLASATWISFMVLYMSYHSAKEQQKVTGQIVLANNLGMLAAFVLSTLLYDVIGMRWLCMMSVTGGAVCVVLSLFLPKGEQIKSEAKISSLLKICLQKRLILFAVLALVQQGVQMSTTMSFTTQIVKDLGASGITVGLSSTVYMLSAVAFAKFATTDLCAKVGPAKWVPAIFVLNAAYCYLVPQCASFLVIFVLQILPGASTGILATYTISEAMKNVPREKKSTAMGFFQAIYALGMTSFPIICGRIAEQSSIGAAYIVMAGTCVAAAIASGIYYRQLYKRMLA